MKRLASLVTLAALAAMPAFAQTAPPKFAPLPPPPGMNDPGTQAVAPPSAPAPAASSTPATVTATPLPGKPIPLPATPGQKAETVPDTHPADDVTVHTEGDAVYQAYHRGGQVYMVVVTMKSGLSYTYTVDDRGVMHATNGAPPVRPVMYKVLQWGGSRAPAAKGDSGQ
ncbi:MAG: DUF2782 domain-containing protein [Rhodanobacter sp.]|nr:MAG: DUF2782 domain-containing protein [Rhodanobacter sp.]TAM15171.1 MAG: DUF2782 domain-containing protein [Rhodanobacter sp.]TAM36359.1 MAG: DUF2782 domain-containing protein [Rhodanobacter sp.]